MLKELFNGSVILAGVGAALVIATSSNHSPAFVSDVLNRAMINHAANEKDIARYPMTFGKSFDQVGGALSVSMLNSNSKSKSSLFSIYSILGR